jgi:ADP-glucose pyrophosphorylase
VEDLLACCLRALRRAGSNAVIGEGAHLPEGTELVETVIGPGVEVEKPARFEQCVILSGVRVAGGATYRNRVFTENDA